MASTVSIGVLCLQGSFSEHIEMLKRLKDVASVTEVRLPSDLEGLDGLIFPGGESTAMAVVGESSGIFPALKEWAKSNRPVWGTCAGMILLSNTAVFQRDGGQALVGGLDIEVCRNFFGSQVQSCEMEINVEVLGAEGGTDGVHDEKSSSRAVLIRAPAVLKVGPDVTVLARVHARPSAAAIQSLKSDGPTTTAPSIEEDTGECIGFENVKERFFKKRRILKPEELMPVGVALDEEPWDVAVAVRQGNLVATAFHPEFTPEDTRWHRYFVEIVRQARSSK